MNHYTDILHDILLKEEQSTRSSSKKLSKKARKRKQRQNRKLKNAYFATCIDKKLYNQTNFQPDTDNVLEVLGYY